MVRQKVNPAPMERIAAPRRFSNTVMRGNSDVTWNERDRPRRLIT